MCENFETDTGIRGCPCNRFYFGKGEFPGKHHPGKSLLMRPPHALRVVDRELGRGVEDKAGHDLPGERRNPGVLHEHGIDPGAVGFIQKPFLITDISQAVSAALAGTP